MRQAAADDLRLLLFSCRSALKQSMELKGAQGIPFQETVAIRLICMMTHNFALWHMGLFLFPFPLKLFAARKPDPKKGPCAAECFANP